MTLTYVIHYICPSFHRNALEYGQHRQAKIVEVRYSEVWPDPTTIAIPVVGTNVSLPTGMWRIESHDFIFDQN